MIDPITRNYTYAINYRKRMLTRPELGYRVLVVPTGSDKGDSVTRLANY